MSGPLAGQVALVTGAAGDLGAAIVAALEAGGAAVLATDLATGPGLLPADLTDPAAPARLVADAVDRFGRLTLLVNNAATVSPRADAVDVTDADWEAALAVNLTAPLRLCRAAIPQMRRAGGGAIVNICSQLGQVPTAGRVAYGASKAGLLFLTRLMALDHAAEGIRVNSLSPGPVETSRLAGRDGSIAAARARLLPRCPVGRLGTPVEIAAAVAWLCGPDAGFVTGTDLLMDGGFSLGPG